MISKGMTVNTLLGTQVTRSEVPVLFSQLSLNNTVYNSYLCELKQSVHAVTHSCSSNGNSEQRSDNFKRRVGAPE